MRKKTIFPIALRYLVVPNDPYVSPGESVDISISFTTVVPALTINSSVLRTQIESAGGQVVVYKMWEENSPIRAIIFDGRNNISPLKIKNVLGKVRKLKKLTSIALVGDKITDEIVKSLKYLRRLRSIEIFWTKVTQKCVDELKAVLPNCSIKYKVRVNENQTNNIIIEK